jgi:hypothetical protein
MHGALKCLPLTPVTHGWSLVAIACMVQSTLDAVHPGSNLMLAWQVGSSAAARETLSDDALVAVVLEELRQVLRVEPPAPVRVAITRWGADPFSRGSYSCSSVAPRHTGAYVRRVEHGQRRVRVWGGAWAQEVLCVCPVLGVGCTLCGVAVVRASLVCRAKGGPVRPRPRCPRGLCGQAAALCGGGVPPGVPLHSPWCPAVGAGGGNQGPGRLGPCNGLAKMTRLTRSPGSRTTPEC